MPATTHLKKLSGRRDRRVATKHGVEWTTHDDGSVEQTPYVGGEIHGLNRRVWDHRREFIEIPYVCGIKHGVEWGTRPDGWWETPYVYGKAHGLGRHMSFVDGVLTETPYVHGVVHGVQRQTWPTGEVVNTLCGSNWSRAARGRWRWLVARKRWWWLSEERANVAACVDKWLLKNGLASWIDAKAARRGAWQTLTQTH